MVACYNVCVMRVVAKKILREFWEKPNRSDSEQPLKSWYKLASQAEWRTPADVKKQLRNASFVGNDRIVFDIAGNKYRLVIAADYKRQTLYIKFVGTHKQYDKINVKEVSYEH